MVKSVLTLFTALVAGLMLLGSTMTASAHYGYHHRPVHYGHRGCCGPVHPTYVYRTEHKVTHLTHYRDVSRTKYVTRIHRIVHITRIQPIVYVHTVTRIHNHTVGVVRSVYQHMTEYLPARRYGSTSTISTYDCRCGGRRCR